jgi:serine protease AprX
MNYIKYLFLLFALITKVSFSQIAPDIYLIEFTDKANSTYSIDHPEDFLSQKALQRRVKFNIPIIQNDIPVNQNYIDSVENIGVQVLSSSRWFNSIIGEITNVDILETLNGISFIKNVSKKHASKSLAPINKFQSEENIITHYRHKKKISIVANDALNYGMSQHHISMLNGQVLHNSGYLGDGMIMAVLDAGFYRTDEMIAFDSLRANNRILGVKDFVEFDDTVYNDHYHGSYVLSLIAANNPGLFIGTAPHAEFYLIETENVNYEYLIEEENWIAGIEYADSVGVDIVTSSVSYYLFNESSQNHTIDDLTGNTTRITRAADIAASKGILVFNSAGNEGNNENWRYLTFPGDADSIMTIGSVDSLGIRAPGSSIGPPDYHIVKPNVVAQGQNVYILNTNDEVGQSSGTSYSTPIVAGLAACLWQANPLKNNYEIIKAIEMSSSQSNNPDQYMGYGIPDFAKANLILSDNLVIENPHDLHANFSPNPVHRKLRVEVLGNNLMDLQVVLVDIVGRIHYSATINNINNSFFQFYIDELDQLEEGMYFVQLSSHDNEFVGKIIIER